MNDTDQEDNKEKVEEQQSVGEFRVGSCIGTAFRVFIANFFPFCTIAAAFTMPIALIEIYGVSQQTSNSIFWNDAVPFIVGTLTFLTGYVVTAALTYGTIQELRGTRSNIAECIRQGIPLLIPVIGVSIVSSIVVGVGFVLLVIPGFILASIFLVAVPVAVVERKRILDCMWRSSDLTKGFRMRIFAVLLISMFATALFAFPLGFAVAFSGSGSGVDEVGFKVQVILNAVISAVTSAFYAVMISVAYHDLRIAKEGGDVEQIAAVFD